MKKTRMAAVLWTIFALSSCDNLHPLPKDNYSRIADHTTVSALMRGKIPESAIVNAKSLLKIGFGHLSHGQQIWWGMNEMVAFANDGRLGGKAYSRNLFSFSQNGASGTLCFFNGSFDRDSSPSDYLSGSAGYSNAHFAEETREFLKSHSSFNVIMWAWCGELSPATEQGVADDYLAQMEALEAKYPNVNFAYMTGHLDGTGTAGNLNQRNEQIRAYCRANDKWLYDFADIESYDPEGNGYLDRLGTDACNYDANGDGIVSVDASVDPARPVGGDRNWALDWQASHAEGVSWYRNSADTCHTQFLNGNMKAYAAWWMFARMAGWDGGLEN